MDYRSEGDTRVTIDGSRHYKTPYGALPSVTTILSATSGSKAALDRWATKNPGGREAAAARRSFISQPDFTPFFGNDLLMTRISSSSSTGSRKSYGAAREAGLF